MAGLLLIQTPFGLGFALLLLRGNRTAVPPSEAAEHKASFPRAVILLPIRGADPKMQESFRLLFSQDYPDYEVQVVVDRESDPSLNLVRQVQSELAADHVNITVLQAASRHCSRQCSALLQGISLSSESSEVVVVIDGDVRTHATWLRELVAATMDPVVGVAHGNRWFSPPDAQWGSWVRYCWNAAAVVPMWVFGIPWGGTFAIRRTVLEESGLKAAWAKAVVQDAPAVSLVKKMGLKVRFIPSLMMINRERCDLTFAQDFFKRQMTWTRLYHPDWWPVLVHAAATTGLQIAAIIVGIIACLGGHYTAATYCLGSIIAYYAGLLGLLAALELSMRRVVDRRGESLAVPNWAALVKLPLCLPLTQLVHLIAVLQANFRNRVAFRGVTYHLRGPFDVDIESDDFTLLERDVTESLKSI